MPEMFSVMYKSVSTDVQPHKLVARLKIPFSEFVSRVSNKFSGKFDSIAFAVSPSILVASEYDG